MLCELLYFYLIVILFDTYIISYIYYIYDYYIYIFIYYSYYYIYYIYLYIHLEKYKDLHIYVYFYKIITRFLQDVTNTVF